jgi:hypothetical protein
MCGDSPGDPHHAQHRHQRSLRDAAEIGDGIGLIVKLPAAALAVPAANRRRITMTPLNTL